MIQGNSNSEFFFENIQEKIYDHLKKSETKLAIAVAWITDNKIFKILSDKLNSGTIIEIIVADDALNYKYEDNYKDIINSGARVFIYPKEKGLMHNKFAIIDNKKVITGSANWTNTVGKNQENINIIYDTHFVKKYSQLFESLLNTSNPFPNVAFNTPTNNSFKNLEKIRNNLITNLVEIIGDFDKKKVKNYYPEFETYEKRVIGKNTFDDYSSFIALELVIGINRYLNSSEEEDAYYENTSDVDTYEEDWDSDKINLWMILRSNRIDWSRSMLEEDFVNKYINFETFSLEYNKELVTNLLLSVQFENYVDLFEKSQKSNLEVKIGAIRVKKGNVVYIFTVNILFEDDIESQIKRAQNQINSSLKTSLFLPFIVPDKIEFFLNSFESTNSFINNAGFNTKKIHIDTLSSSYDIYESELLSIYINSGYLKKNGKIFNYDIILDCMSIEYFTQSNGLPYIKNEDDSIENYYQYGYEYFNDKEVLKFAQSRGLIVNNSINSNDLILKLVNFFNEKYNDFLNPYEKMNQKRFFYLKSDIRYKLFCIKTLFKE